MVTFDGAVSGAKKAFDTAAEKTGEAIEISKLHVKRAQLKNRLGSLYGKLGRASYNTSKGLRDESEAIERLTLEIDRQIEAIRRNERDISDASPVVCHVCGKKNPPKSIICKACGTELIRAKTAPAEDKQEEVDCTDIECVQEEVTENE